MNYVVWEFAPWKNWCMLDALENVEYDTNLTRGRPFGNTFPKNATFRMAKRHKTATALVDDVANLDTVKVCSARLVEFLQKRKIKGLEYLPVTILNHKDKVASKEYFIVHQINLQDALDPIASGAEYSPIEKGEIDSVEQLVFRPEKINPDMRVFRLKHYTFPVLIDQALASEMEKLGFQGSYFRPLEEYPG